MGGNYKNGKDCTDAYYDARCAGVPPLIAGLIILGLHYWDRDEQRLTLIHENGQELIYEHKMRILRFEDATKRAELHNDFLHAQSFMNLDSLPRDIKMMQNAFELRPILGWIPDSSDFKNASPCYDREELLQAAAKMTTLNFKHRVEAYGDPQLDYQCMCLMIQAVGELPWFDERSYIHQFADQRWVSEVIASHVANKIEKAQTMVANLNHTISKTSPQKVEREI